MYRTHGGLYNTNGIFNTLGGIFKSIGGAVPVIGGAIQSIGGVMQTIDPGGSGAGGTQPVVPGGATITPGAARRAATHAQNKAYCLAQGHIKFSPAYTACMVSQVAAQSYAPSAPGGTVAGGTIPAISLPGIGGISPIILIVGGIILLFFVFK